MPDLYHLPGFYEPFSAVSHLIGAVVFLVLGSWLLYHCRHQRACLVFYGVYLGSCVLLFSMSGVYHMLLRGSPAGRVIERLDHGAIFILIAGSFTPAHGLLFRGWLRWGPLVLIWALAVTGVTLKVIFFSDFAEWVGLSLYLGLGWLGAVSGTLLGLRYGWRFIKPLLWGGIAYSIGATMEFVGWPVLIAGAVHPHEVFHVAVLVAALYHLRFNWQFCATCCCPQCRSADAVTLETQATPKKLPVS